MTVTGLSGVNAAIGRSRRRPWVFTLIFLVVISVCPAAGAETTGAPAVLKTLMGRASWYRGLFVADGTFFKNGYYAAMRDVPLGTRVRVTNLEGNGKSIVVSINDRGPNKRLVRKGRLIDLTEKAFRDLGGDIRGSTIQVKLEILR